MSIQYQSMADITLRCKRLEPMVDFYARQMGLAEKERVANADGSLRAVVFAVGDGQTLTLLAQPYQGENVYEQRSHVHFCFEVEDEAEMLTVLDQRGVTIYDAPMWAEMQKPYQGKPLGMCGSRCAFVVDPEGNWMEIMQFTSTSLQLLCDKE